MEIIPYDARYRDDMIFMILEAKNALGRVPRLNEDLLNIQQNYFSCGGGFWLAIDENDRVIGSVGYSLIPNTNDVILHRLYVKATLKRKGIGSQLLQTAENHAMKHGKIGVLVHLGGKEYYESQQFYPKHGFVEVGTKLMRKDLL